MNDLHSGSILHQLCQFLFTSPFTNRKKGEVVGQ